MNTGSDYYFDRKGISYYSLLLCDPSRNLQTVWRTDFQPLVGMPSGAPDHIWA